MQKRGYFLTLDAFVAVMLLVTGLLLIFSMQSQKPYDTQALYYSQDVMNSLSDTSVQEINDPYINALRQNGTVINSGNSLIQQIGEFYVNNDMSTASSFSQAAITSINSQYGFRVVVNNYVIYNTSIPPNDTNVVSASKTIVYGTVNKTRLWGPYIAEVTTWQR